VLKVSELVRNFFIQNLVPVVMSSNVMKWPSTLDILKMGSTIIFRLTVVIVGFCVE